MAKRTRSTRTDAPSITDGPAQYASTDYAAMSGSAEPASTGSTGASDAQARERIAARAYELYLQRGGGPGRETDDWLEAERELQVRSQQSGRQSQESNQ
jgi:hypothetical protein